MIPTIENIVRGLLDGSYSADQAIAWLHDHAACAWSSEDRLMLAGMAMQAIIPTTYQPRRGGPEGAAEEAAEYADALLKALRLSGNQSQEK